MASKTNLIIISSSNGKNLELSKKFLPKKLVKTRNVSWIVGKLVYEALIPTQEKLNKIENLKINLYGLPSQYWGQEQVVTGLLTGEDLIEGLKDKDLGEAIYIPAMMLKVGSDLFLDDTKIEDVEKKLGTKIHVVYEANDIIKDLVGQSSGKKFN